MVKDKEWTSTQIAKKYKNKEQLLSSSSRQKTRGQQIKLGSGERNIFTQCTVKIQSSFSQNAADSK